MSDKTKNIVNVIQNYYEEKLRKDYIRNMIIGWETAMHTLDKYMSSHTYKETKAYVKHCLSEKGKEAMKEVAFKDRS